MGNVKFKVWENPPSGKIATYVRESALKASVALGNMEPGNHIIQTAFGDWPDALCNELKQFEDRFKSRQ